MVFGVRFSVISALTLLVTAPAILGEDRVGPPASYPISEVTISLEATAWHGTCPVYKVVLRGDGTGQFQGTSHVSKTGTETLRVPVKDMFSVLEKVYAYNFFDMKDVYDSTVWPELAEDGIVSMMSLHVSDQPSEIITVTIFSYKKTVRNYDNAPPGLDTLARMIRDVAGVESWIRKPVPR